MNIPELLDLLRRIHTAPWDLKTLVQLQSKSTYGQLGQIVYGKDYALRYYFNPIIENRGSIPIYGPPKLSCGPVSTRIINVSGLGWPLSATQKEMQNLQLLVSQLEVRFTKEFHGRVMPEYDRMCPRVEKLRRARARRNSPKMEAERELRRTEADLSKFSTLIRNRSLRVPEEDVLAVWRFIRDNTRVLPVLTGFLADNPRVSSATDSEIERIFAEARIHEIHRS